MEGLRVVCFVGARDGLCRENNYRDEIRTMTFLESFETMRDKSMLLYGCIYEGFKEEDC